MRLDNIMKLLRFREDNFIKPGVLDNTGKIRDISSLVDDWTGKTINDETIKKIKKYNKCYKKIQKG